MAGEIGKRPTSDRIQDREAYTLAAGLALGFVTLGKGGDGGTFVLWWVFLLFHTYTAFSIRALSSPKHTCSNGHPSGALGLADLRIEERLHRYMVGGTVSAAAAPHRSRYVFHMSCLVECLYGPFASCALSLIVRRAMCPCVGSSHPLPSLHNAHRDDGIGGGAGGKDRWYGPGPFPWQEGKGSRVCVCWGGRVCGCV